MGAAVAVLVVGDYQPVEYRYGVGSDHWGAGSDLEVVDSALAVADFAERHIVVLLAGEQAVGFRT